MRAERDSSELRVFILLSAGQGPAECAWVVYRLVPILQAEARALGLVVEEIERRPGPRPETCASVIVELRAETKTQKALHGLIEGWQGTIQWIGKSPLRSAHRRRNWFIKATTIDLREPTIAELRPADLEITAIRGSGAGGQNVNKRSTAVRIRDQASGLEVVAREERTQGQNRRVALERLRALLAARAAEGHAAGEQARWGQHQVIERGNASRVFRGLEFRES